MAFPQTPLSRILEMYVDGAWTDYTSKIIGKQNQPDSVAISQRGRRDEQTQGQNTSLIAMLDNTGLEFSNLAPTSPNFRKIDVNTPVRYGITRDGDTGPATVTETFTRSFIWGWGESDSGHDWIALSNNVYSIANVTGSTGTINLGSAGTNRDMIVNQRFTDVNVLLDWSVVTPTGARVEPALILRATDGDNYIMVRTHVNTDNTLEITARVRFGAIERELSLVEITDRTYTSGATWKLRARIEGTVLQARIWDSALSEPSTWDLDIAQCGLVTSGFVGIRSGIASGNTSFPHVFTYAAFSATALNATTHWRFHGELGELSPASDTTGIALSAFMNAAGPLRRIAQGEKSLGSPIKRAILAAGNAPYLVAYWPVEEGTNATLVSSASGANDGVVVDTINFGAFVDSPATDALAVLDTGRITFTVPSYSSTMHKAAMLWDFPTAGTVDTNDVLVRINCIGTLAYIDIKYSTGGALIFSATSTGGTVTSSAAIGFNTDDEHFYFAVELTQDGSDIDYTMVVSHIDVNEAVGIGLGSGSVSGVTCTAIKEIIVNPFGHLAGESVAFGQLAVANYVGAFANIQSAGTGVSALVGHTGERAGSRFQRVCIEEGLSAEIIGLPEDTQQMGPQTNATLMQVLTSCETADRGIMFDSRKANVPAYRTHVSMQNQYPALVISYGNGDLSPPFTPRYDDAGIWNDVTFSRPNGGRVRTFEASGSRSINPPPNGVGSYDRGEVQANVYTDSQLGDLSARTRVLGTMDSYRFPQATIELARSNWNSAANIIKATNVEVGDIVRISGLPEWLGPAGTDDFDDTYQLVQGFSESGHQKGLRLNFNITPGERWETELIAPDDTTVAIEYDSTDTTLLWANGLGPTWSEDTEPYLIEIVETGEVIRVNSAVNLTPAFQGEGTIAHGNNASVIPTLPAGSQDGWGLLMPAAIRNSGTGSVNTPAGWEKIVDFGNFALLGAHYDLANGVSNSPTVTFANGAANATTTAQVFAFSGMSMKIGSGTKATPAAATQLNGSAANIATPALDVVRGLSVVLSAVWKQDDWTSVANGLSFTEVMDDFSILGDDQGLALAYSIQGSTPSDIASGSWTVTGGASAISRAIMVALRPLQEVSVDRSVNGVVAAIPAGSTVRLWRNAFIGL